MTFFASPTFIGVDIKPQGIRILELQKSKHNYLIKRLIRYELPYGVFQDEKIKRWDSLSLHLTEVVKTHGLINAYAAISLPADMVQMQRAQLAVDMAHADIEGEIQRQLQRDLPDMNDELSIDFGILSQHKDYIDVFFAAARQTYVEQFAACVNASGLQTRIIDLDMYAIIRAIAYIDPSVQAILYIANQTATLLIANTNYIEFQQRWFVTNTQDIFAELQARILLYQSSHPQIEMTKLALMGVDQQTVEKIQAHGYECYSPNPFARMKLTNIENNPCSDDLIACGLAMREVPIW